ncbi:MAG: glycosyl transferase family 39, partial [Cyanobacteria bacterium P01_H01_bin.105]
MTLLEKKTSYGFYGVVIVAIALGIWVRFINIEGKVYWHDEAYTALFATGHSRDEARSLIFANELRSAAELQSLQQVDPERGAQQLLQRLITEDSQHPPLYYLVARWFMGIWDNA